MTRTITSDRQRVRLEYSYGEDRVEALAEVVEDLANVVEGLGWALDIEVCREAADRAREQARLVAGTERPGARCRPLHRKAGAS